MSEKLTIYEHSTIEAKHTINQATLGSDKSLQAQIKNRLSIGNKTFNKVINNLDLTCKKCKDNLFTTSFIVMKLHVWTPVLNVASMPL